MRAYMGVIEVCQSDPHEEAGPAIPHYVMRVSARRVDRSQRQDQGHGGGGCHRHQEPGHQSRDPGQ